MDTTYLLAAVGISVKGLPRDAVIQLSRRGHGISISEVTLFELCANGAKRVAGGGLTGERVSRGIRAVVYDDRIARIPMHDTSVLLTAFRLRRRLSDIIDCLILSSAVNRCDVLVTEDEDILDLSRKDEFQGLLRAVNPEFRVQRLAEIL